jgi:hypothetical protein
VICSKVERISVVDKNGTLRLVISNTDRMHPGVFDGVMIERERPLAGIIFFNDQGDEVGGLVTTGQEVNGVREADTGLTFDQLKQDQTIGLMYSESQGRRMAALKVWDRPEQHLTDLITNSDDLFDRSGSSCLPRATDIKEPSSAVRRPAAVRRGAQENQP